MLQSVHLAEWVVLYVQLPGKTPLQPAGVLLLSSQDNQLHIRLLKELTDAPEDVKEVWTYLEDDLAEEAQSFGGREVLNRLETSLSHVFQLGQKELEALTMKAADRADQLFASRIALASDEGSGSTRYEPSFSPQELISAQRAGPSASAIGRQLMAALSQDDIDFSKIEGIANCDPALATHLIKLANTMKFSRGEAIRSISKAMLQMGSTFTKSQIQAFFLRQAYESDPYLRTVWNHSLEVAQWMRNAGLSAPAETALLGLIHDIGRVVLWALGPRYREMFSQLIRQGNSVVEAELRLTGFSHPIVGANWLRACCFPADFVHAVRFHHTPSESASPLAAALFLSEAMSEDAECVADISEYRSAVTTLQGFKQITATENLDDDLSMLAISATV